MNLEHKVLTGNPTGNSRCQALESRALNTSCYFDQSAGSIESRCVVILSEENGQSQSGFIYIVRLLPLVVPGIMDVFSTSGSSARQCPPSLYFR